MKIVFIVAGFMVLAACRVTTPIQKEPVSAKEKGKRAMIERSGAGNSDDTEPYRISPGDVLHISVWNNEELTQDVTVRPDGKISLPLIQDVTASGFTTEELRKLIEVRLKEFIIEPVVTVVVKEVNYPKFYIMGEVAKPGMYILKEKISLLQAISMAGGFTVFASPSKIVLIRSNGSYQKKMDIDYYKIVKSRELSQNVYLKPGDIIIIP